MRGVAALCVAVYHNQGLFSGTAFFNWGWTNVDLFFLISGIVLSHVYEERITKGSTSFTEFLSHRIARIWPLHFFAMMTMFVINNVSDKYYMDFHAPVYTFLLNLFLLQNMGLYGFGTTDGHTWDGNAWSLTPEIGINLIWFYLLTRRRLLSKLLVTIMLVFAVLQYNLGGGSVCALILDSNLIRCTISFAMGCLLYRHLIGNPAVTPLPRFWANVTGLILVNIIALSVAEYALGGSPLFVHWDWILILFVFPAFAFCTSQPDTLLNKIFSSKLAVYLGTISFSIYLLHVPIAITLNGAAQTFLGPYFIFTRPFGGLLFLGLTIVLSAAAYKYIEKPSRRFLRDRLDPFLRKIIFDVY
jgi:peptidoglycan/LPS O-acetylase OafA/YrhL